MAFLPGGDRLPAGQRPDQRYRPPPPSLKAGGQAGILRARQVIISGTPDGLFVYDGTPAAGTLIASIAAAKGTDSYGNAYVEGVVAYNDVGWYVQVNDSTISFNSLTSPLPQGPEIQWTGSGFAELQVGSGITSGAGDQECGLNIYSSATSPTGVAGVAVAGTMFLSEQTSAPSTPTSGGVLYVNSAGDLYYLGPSGTSTKIADA